MSRPRRELHEQNRRSWNHAVQAHNSHKQDQAAFLRGGGSTLFPEELDLLGELTGRTLLHLSCNAGQDTLSLARLGARVTGVDISDDAISFAEKLASDSGIPGRFERADVYDWLPQAAREHRSFDRVFMSYGVLGWLSDLEALLSGIARVLAPGGRFVLVELHPFAMMFDESGVLRHPYAGGGEPTAWQEGVGDYVALNGGAALTPSGWIDGTADFANPEPSWEFAWSLSDVLTAVIDAELRLEHIREWPYANAWQPFPAMRDLGQRRFAAPASLPGLPLMFGLAAARAR
jgi:SAM-dependent methyltransferase